MSYILNINTKVVHNSEKTDKRCRLYLLSDANKMEFDTLEEAFRHISTTGKPTRPCAFCMKKQ